VLGILTAGCAYLPLNHDHPPARIAHQLVQSSTRVVISEQHLLGSLSGFDGAIVCLDRDRERIAAFSDRDPERVSEPHHPAYVMYTSGSTGLPKGVIVTHANLANYATQTAERLRGQDGPTLRFGVVSAIRTDLGNTCIFPPLISG